jgi:alkylation response protein AidB-like acyl-CoA dehydrogenase
MAIADSRTRSPLDEARRLAPLIRSYADQIEAERALPRPLFEALADAGLFLLAVPRAIGGGEIDLPTYIQVIEELGKADASTAWTVNQGAIFAGFSSHLPPEVARAIWIEPPRSVVANTPGAVATAVAVPGGYRVSGGPMGFSTGCTHATWLAPHARVVENGQPRLLPSGQPETRYLFVPVEQAEILDTWQVHGMRGTGTHHFRVDDVFVPAERSFSPTGSRPRQPGPLYLFPRTLQFASGDASVALGLARTCLQTFVELAAGKTVYRTEGLLRDQGRVQADVGLAEAQIRSSRALLSDTIGEVWEQVSAAGAITLDQRASIRLATTHALRQAVLVVDACYNNAGATAIYQSSPLQRYFQDIHVISQHIQSRLTNYELVGRHYLGLEVDTNRL